MHDGGMIWHHHSPLILTMAKTASSAANRSQDASELSPESLYDVYGDTAAALEACSSLERHTRIQPHALVVSVVIFVGFVDRDSFKTNGGMGTESASTRRLIFGPKEETSGLNSVVQQIVGAICNRTSQGTPRLPCWTY